MVLTIPRGVVRNLKVLSNMPVGGCSVAHMVHVLLGKIDPGLTQDLYVQSGFVALQWGGEQSNVTARI
jgi:hypothetical protein